MIWHVSDDGKVVVRLNAEGEAAKQMTRDRVDAYITEIASDLSASQSIEVVTDELRYSFSKTHVEITVTWRASAPAAAAPDIREYLTRLSRSLDPVQGEVVDEPPD